MAKAGEEYSDDESELLDTRTSCTTTNTELLHREYYAMMECPKEPARSESLCEKHAEERQNEGVENNVLVTSGFSKIEEDVEHGLVPFRMQGRGNRWLSNVQCVMVLFCFFLVFIICVAPIFFTLKHAVTGGSEKHEQFAVIGN